MNQNNSNHSNKYSGNSGDHCRTSNSNDNCNSTNQINHQCESNPYADIINLPHHVSTKRPQMPMSDRAAQFSPFAALTGHEDAIKETGRLTDRKIEMDKESLVKLNMKYQILVEMLAGNMSASSSRGTSSSGDSAPLPLVTITYFKPDDRKAGGAYPSVTGIVKKVDDFEKLLILMDGTKIPMDDIVSLEGEMFPEMV